MDRISVTGGRKLEGQIYISGSKNAALPIMAATLLTKDTVVLSNIPNLADITTMANLLIQLGAHLTIDGTNCNERTMGRNILVSCKEVASIEAPYEIVRKMRASVLVLGPLLARFGEAIVSLPGGCAIGTRPIDLHISALEQMGAKIILEEGYVHAKVAGRLKGADITFRVISVGATENILMAACLADGTTRLFNAAMEPEIVDLANMLVKMGAKIKGIGTSTLEIEGVTELHGAHHNVIPDRIETGTYAIAASITGGHVELLNVNNSICENIYEKLSRTGSKLTQTENGIVIDNRDNIIKSQDLVTQAFPGFPTDMQAQFMTLLAFGDGTSIIEETIFENRFMHVPELMRMGADINVSSGKAIVRGIKSLKGAPVMATDLRASVSLVLAALRAEGETTINRVYHIDRGYERIEEKLNACGAKIERMRETQL